nr:hypothetical protein [Cressdnaviricota sp.]
MNDNCIAPFFLETEGFCRACYNYWRFCDCVGDLGETPDENKEDNTGEDPDRDEMDVDAGLPDGPPVVTPGDVPDDGYMSDFDLDPPSPPPNRNLFPHGRTPPRRQAPDVVILIPPLADGPDPDLDQMDIDLGGTVNRWDIIPVPDDTRLDSINRRRDIIKRNPQQGVALPTGNDPVIRPISRPSGKIPITNPYRPAPGKPYNLKDWLTGVIKGRPAPGNPSKRQVVPNTTGWRLPDYIPNGTDYVGMDLDYPDPVPTSSAPGFDDVSVVTYDQEPDPDTYIPWDFSSALDGITDAVNTARDWLTPRVMTEPEILDIIRDGKMPPDVVRYANSLPIPTLDAITTYPGPFNRARNDAAWNLQGPTGPPSFTGQPYTKDLKNFSNEYKSWYETQFKPWYRQAGPREKIWVEGLKCVNPPPDYSWPNPNGDPQFIDVTYSSADYSGKDEWHWTGLDGKSYVMKGDLGPSPDMIYNPQKYKPKPFTIGGDRYTLEWIPKFNDTTIGANRTGRNGRRPVGINGFYFDDDDRRPPIDYLTDIINPPPIIVPPFSTPDIHPTNTTISSGTGSAVDLYVGGLVDEVNVWKYVTYQTGFMGRGDWLTVEGTGFPFFTSGSRYRLQVSGDVTTNLFIHNHMKVGSVGIHGLVYLRFRSTFGFYARVTTSDNTVLEVADNVASSSALLNILTPSTTGPSNGLCYFTPVNGVITVAVYIRPNNNMKFDTTKSGQSYFKMQILYQQVDAIIRYGQPIFIEELAHFRNLDTTTPGFRANSNLETLQVPNLDNSDVVSGTVGVNTDLFINNISGTDDTNVPELFTKVFFWVKQSKAVTMVYTRSNIATGVVSSQNRISPSHPGVLGRWHLWPLGPGDIINNNLAYIGTRLAGVLADIPNGNEVLGYRLIKLSVASSWRS